MNRDDIIRMAREAGFHVSKWDDEVDEVMDGDNYHIQTDLIECFAALVAAAERENIASWIALQRNDVPATGFEIASAIRAKRDQ